MKRGAKSALILLGFMSLGFYSPSCSGEQMGLWPGSLPPSRLQVGGGGCSDRAQGPGGRPRPPPPGRVRGGGGLRVGPHKARPPRRTPETPKVTASDPGLGGPRASPITRWTGCQVGATGPRPTSKHRGSAGPWPCPSGTSKGHRVAGGGRSTERLGLQSRGSVQEHPAPPGAPGHPHPGGSPRGPSPNRRHLQ